MLAVTPNVLFWLSLERLPAYPGTKVVGLALVDGYINRGRVTDLHATNRVRIAWFVDLLFHYCLL